MKSAIALTDPETTGTARRTSIAPMTFSTCTRYFRLRFIQPRNGRARTAASAKGDVMPSP
jgi:hypothetical protein